MILGTTIWRYYTKLQEGSLFTPMSAGEGLFIGLTLAVAQLP